MMMNSIYKIYVDEENNILLFFRWAFIICASGKKTLFKF